MYYGNDKEDQFIAETFKLLPKKGVMVDVGAGPDGIQGSNSYYFEKKGWKVVCVDADPRNVENLQKNRKIGIGALVSNKEEKLKFYMNDKTPDISGIIKTKDNDKGYVEIIPTKLETILTDQKIEGIDILSIDTEGSEIDVFESMNWEKHKPKILIIEAITQGKFNSEIQPYFENRGYALVAEVGANLIFGFKTLPVRNPHLIIYGSSYDRGLEHLLKMWPDVVKEVPDAQLHIFYGWNLFDLGYRDNPERMAWKEKINEMMKQPGITHYGRISHQACVVENQIAGIWAYPTHFGEISCITGMRAQIYGAVPCVIDYAALETTVKYGVKIHGDIFEPEIKDKFKNELIALLKDTEKQEEIRKEMMPWAKEQFGWSKVAKQWDEEFKKEITPEEKALKLILEDEPLEAIDILPDESLLKKRLIKKLEHIFNPEKYLEKYANDPMNWKPENVNYDRHNWILDEAKDAKSLIDLGCYEGSLVLKAHEMGKKAKGVEICKEAVKFNLEKGLDVVEGDVQTYKDKVKYDAVCACEVIEHIPSPKDLINTMLNLASDTGWCYITTPNGCYDPASTLKVWIDDDALIDHVRAYSEAKIKDLLKGLEYQIKVNGKELYVKFRKDLSKEVEALMEDNQALKAWNLVKDTDSPLKDRVWLRVKHAFNQDDYKKYYSEDLTENPLPEEIALDCTHLYPRLKWLVDTILKRGYKSAVDLGCADGYLCLTLANKKVECLGVNLYKPSIDLAKQRAEKHNLPAKFSCRDLMTVDQKAEAVILFEVLEHLPDPSMAIKKCLSLVKKGGSLFVSTPSPEHIGITLHKNEEGRVKGDWDDGKPSGHLRIFTESELKDLVKGHKIEQFEVDEQGCFLMEVRV